MKKLLLALLLAAMPFAHGALAADTLTIAAAADLTYCLDELNPLFKQRYPDADLKVSSGSSGNFFAQIKSGAPFDVFMSADMEYPKSLVKDGFADGSSLTPYATGRIVLWATDRAVDVSKGLPVVATAVVEKLAIANPEHAPYGRAAKAALQSAGLWDGVQGKLVMGENIAQTAQFLQTGNVSAAIVALSLVKAPQTAGVGRYFVIPADLYPPLEQGAVITAKGKDNALANAYIRFLGSAAARVVFDKYGFVLPASEK